jgi:RNA 2',3'-cyclic 3'-phosphodiesterase
MKRRLFVAINLPEDVKNRLGRKIEKGQTLPVRWARKENLHLTLAFLGYVDDQQIEPLIIRIKQALDNCAGFDLSFDAIALGPDREDPKMIWLTGAGSRELTVLHEKVGQAVGFLVREHKTFRPHVTLGKIRRQPPPEPALLAGFSESFAVTFPVYSVELMSNELSKDGPGYVVLESIELE